MKHARVPLLLVLLLGACESENRFARVFTIDSMAQTIGGPAALARPGDYMLENDRIRAVIHGRHNMRCSNPIANGSLVDIDLQRPYHRYGVGRGKDAFYELGPMINLKVNSSVKMAQGRCDEVGAAPCPDEEARCSRVTASGKGDAIMGIIGLLDLAIQPKADGKEVYDPEKLRMTTDYDICPGEPFVRVTTSASFQESGTTTPVDMEELQTQTGLLDVMLGEHTGQDCARQPCPAGQSCDDLLLNLKVAGLNMEMKRCRKPDQKLAGILAGDLTLFSGKVNVFVPGNGFDHESYVRSLFDTGQDVFSKPLSMRYIVAVGNGVSYAYYNTGGEVMIPVFSESFTVSMTNRFACKRSDPGCLAGKQLRYRRYVSVGQGDVASALEGFYKVQKVPTGRLEGHVVNAENRAPLSDVDVFVYQVPAGWEKLEDSAIGAATYHQLVAQHKKESATTDNPEGQLGIISHFRSDTGIDNVKDGSFAGPLPVAGPPSISCPSSECRYILVAQSRGRAPSGLYPVRVRRGATTRVTMIAGHSATLDYDVQDASGRALPAKLTFGHCFPECAAAADCKSGEVCDDTTRICRPAAGYQGAGDCRPDQQWNGKTCACLDSGRLPLSHGGVRYADHTVHVVQTASGKGRVQMEPGSYEVIISRGMEYEISRQFIDLPGHMTRRIKAVLPRVVDTRGWISADFHVHGPGSVDSGLDHQRRVTSYASEGVELLSASDHDNLTDYGPMIYELGLQGWIKSQTGVEVSPLDYGHFIGFPLRFNENAELNGSFHWRQNDPGGDPDWTNMTPSGIFKKLREIGSLGVDRTVVFVAHFYDHFTFYNVDPFDLNLNFSITSMFNPVLSPTNFSGDFDALEAFNGKNLDVVRRPTYEEVQGYNVALAQLLKKQGLSYDERQSQLLQLSASYQRRFIERTPEEQKPALSFANPDFECRCVADEDCGSGSICDRATGACRTGCADDSECDATLVAAGREACQPVDSSDPSRKTCQRLALSCTGDSDCTEPFGGSNEKCVSGKCELPCTENSHCTDLLRPHCDTQSSTCGPAEAAGANAPCITMRGTVDDWFQMLNRGIRRPILGNSDSHTTYSVEGGIPRNYVRLSTDLPQRIKSAEVAERVKKGQSFPTYGPFVELTIQGQPTGSTVTAKAGEQISLKLRVQSPLWFDVDRIEVYRNGEEIKTITATADCDDNSRCIRTPNNTVVDFDGTITDKPTRDSWYVVAVMGLNGKPLTPVYSSTPVARLGIFELIQRLTPLLPPLRSLRTPLTPSMGIVRPYAMTNPVWVDIDGDGLEPVATPPGWAPERDLQGMKRSALTSSKQGHTHDHRAGLGRMRLNAKQLIQAAREGGVTLPMLKQAFNQLRYFGR